ncbi:MAG: hypothetical protein KQH57_17065 [Actinomycetales bacterium]|nr:hypothetical protein [Actinomycetales bacterium]
MRDLPDAFEQIARGAAGHAHIGGAQDGAGAPSDALDVLLTETGRRRRRFVATTVVAGAAVGLVVAGGAAVLHRADPPPIGPVATSPSPTPTPTGDTSTDRAGTWLGCGADASGLDTISVDGLTLLGSLSPDGSDGGLRLYAVVAKGAGPATPRGGTDTVHWVAVQDGRAVADAGTTMPAATHTLDPGGYDDLGLDVGLTDLTDCRTGDPLTGAYDLWLRADLGTGAGSTTLVAEPLWATDDPAPVPAAIPLVGDGRQLGLEDRVVLERQTGPAQWQVVVSVGGAVRDAYPTIHDALLAAGFTAVGEKTDPQRPSWTSARFLGAGYTVTVDVSNETGGDTFADWTVTSDQDGSGPGAESGWVAVEPPPASARETTLVDVATRAGVENAGPAERNVGDVANVWGLWHGQEALLQVHGPSTGSAWTAREPVDLGAVPGTVAADSDGGLGVEFSCGELTYSVQVTDAADLQSTDLPAAVELATAMAGAAC